MRIEPVRIERIESHQLPPGVIGAASPSPVRIEHDERIERIERPGSPRAGGGGGPMGIEPVCIERIEPHQLPARG